MIGEEDMQYRTHKFGTAVLQQMYKFYQEGQFCDFQIKVEDKVFKVHRLVFASSSDYFQAMLSHDMVETRQESTNLKGMTLKGIEPLIEYVYTGKLDIDLDNVQDVIAGATFLQISHAVDLCIKFLKENMTFDNAEDLLKIGDMFSVPRLREYYRNYILKNFLKFVESDTFLKTDENVLADYLSDDGLITTSESILFHHCMRWYKHDPITRAPVAQKVFENVRMCIDGMPLIHFASNNEIFKSNKNCKEILDYNTNYLNTAGTSYILNTSHRTRVRSPRKTIIQIGGVMEADENYDSFRDMMTQPTNDPCGWNMNNYFHPDLKAWFPLGEEGNQRTYRTSHQKFVEVNGKGVIIGGYEYIMSGTSMNKLAIKDVKLFSAQDVFQLLDMPPLLHERARHAAVYLHGYIYAIGGRDDNKVLKSVERFDCNTQTWGYVKAIPKKTYDHAATTCDGKIYISGGSHHMVRDAKKLVWCYDPSRNNWKKKADMQCARSGHGMVHLDSKLYVCGGYNGNREATNPDGQLRCLVSMEQYNILTNQWTKMATMMFGICFFEMTVLDKRIVVLGGLDTEGRITQYMHEYIVAQDKWKVFGELPRPLKNACCGAVSIKLTDFGCMEDETDEMAKEFEALYFANYTSMNAGDMTYARQLHYERMMENFEPGDYLIDDDSEEEDDFYLS